MNIRISHVLGLLNSSEVSLGMQYLYSPSSYLVITTRRYRGCQCLWMVSNLYAQSSIHALRIVSSHCGCKLEHGIFFRRFPLLCSVIYYLFNFLTCFGLDGNSFCWEIMGIVACTFDTIVPQSEVCSSLAPLPFRDFNFLHSSCLFSISGQRWPSYNNLTSAHLRGRRGYSLRHLAYRILASATEQSMRFLFSFLFSFTNIYKHICRLLFHILMRTFHMMRGKHCWQIMVSDVGAQSA